MGSQLWKNDLMPFALQLKENAVSNSGLGKANVGTCLMKVDEVYPPLRGVLGRPWKLVTS